jgi:hypothetical protein
MKIGDGVMKIAGFVIGLTFACGGSAFAQATRPADPANKPSVSTALDVRANEAFSTGQYALALPLLQKVEAGETSDPTKYGATAEQIRVCEANLALPPSPPAPTVGPGSEAVPMSPETRKAHPAPKPSSMLEMSIKELGNFEYDQVNGGDIPADVKRLSGSMIRLTGFMVPSDQAENITQFALVPSLFSCCFGQPPQIQHTVMVNCPSGKAVSYFPDPIVVEGKLTVDEKKDDGYIVSIFSVDVTSVKPAPK